MSVLERAINNLKKAAESSKEAKAKEPIARAAAVAETDATPEGFGIRQRPRSTAQVRIEFNFEGLRDAGILALGNQQLADEYRMIKRPLLKNALGQGASSHRRRNLLMVASALPGDGKTFTSVNLSMSLASEKDWDVLLVDADCKKPQLSRLLGVTDQPGLLDLLRDPEQTLEALTLATNIDGLYVLPIGARGEDAAELLGSARMGAVCDRLAQSDQKQIVIFDSSPMLVTTEAVTLSGQVGQVVIVVHANRTPQQAVLETVGKLDPSAAVGLILNRIDHEGEANRYGGYGSYGAD